MTRAEQAWVTELLSQDVDDIVRAAEHLATGQKLAKLRLIASFVPSLDDELGHAKAASFVQAVLGSLTAKVVPVGIAAAIVAAVAPLTDVKAHGTDVRRSAYHVVALVFLRARVLTPALDSQVRTAFKQGKRDPHPAIREFSRNAERNVLPQREPQATAAFNARIRDAASLTAVRRAASAAKRERPNSRSRSGA